MKTHDELVEEQHKQCIKNIHMIIDERMSKLMHEKAMAENTLNGMKIAVESLGHPDLDKYGNGDIVSNVFSNILDLKEIQKKIDALIETQRFIEECEEKTFLKG